MMTGATARSVDYGSSKDVAFFSRVSSFAPRRPSRGLADSCLPVTPNVGTAFLSAMKRWTPRGARAPRGGGTEASAASVTSARRVFRMNCEIHQLAPLRCEAFQAKEVMRAVLHTVLFTRALGVVRPRDVDCELFDLSYATCGDPGVDAAVEERLDALQAWLHRKTRAGGETHARVTLSFHELGDGESFHKKQSACWEQWRVPLEVVVVDGAPRALREQLALELQDALRGAIQHVIGLAGERKDHIPPVTTNKAACFPFNVGLPAEEEEKRNGALGTLKKLLVDASPPSMLG